MKKIIFFLLAILLTSCFGQNAPGDSGRTVVTEVIKISDNVYYNRVDMISTYYSFSANNTYISTQTPKFIVGDTIVFISKRELRELLNKK